MKQSESVEATVRSLCDRAERIRSELGEFELSAETVELDQTVQGRLSRIDAVSQQQMA